VAIAVDRTTRMRESIAPFLRFFEGPIWERREDPAAANFAVGNPQEMPIPAYVDALRMHLEPQDKDWFAYKLSEPNARNTVAATLSRRTGLAWDPEDVFMTNAGFGALAVTFRALLEPGDEVVFLSPPWFFYELLVLAAGGEPRRVRLEPPAFDLDPDAIAAAITPRTRAVLVNTPHNPTGRVYSIEALGRLADALTAASERIGHRIHVISDEPYNRIVFDGRRAPSPAEVYADTLVMYSYGKTLLAPGMRIGYIALPPTMAGREPLRERIFLSQFATGFAFPDALLQHAIEDIEGLSIDIAAMQRRRDRLIPALRDLGYEASIPEGTFYSMVKAPIDDDMAFSERLARHDVLVLPGTVVEVPGWFRISLTASDGMVERGLEGFARARTEALGAGG
jgi:aspartate aminotransferase